MQTEQRIVTFGRLPADKALEIRGIDTNAGGWTNDDDGPGRITVREGHELVIRKEANGNVSVFFRYPVRE